MSTLIQSPEDVPNDAVVPKDAVPGSLAVYHTPEDCRHLDSCGETRPLTWDDARTTIRECNYCQGMTVPVLDGLPENAVVSGNKSPMQLEVYHTQEECQSFPEKPVDPGELSAAGELRMCRLCRELD